MNYPILHLPKDFCHLLNDFTLRGTDRNDAEAYELLYKNTQLRMIISCIRQEEEFNKYKTEGQLIKTLGWEKTRNEMARRYLHFQIISRIYSSSGFRY